MPHIDLPAGVPGIIALFEQYPGVAIHLTRLAGAVLRGPSPLTPGEREMIAGYVSDRNNCVFCAESHSAAARILLRDRAPEVDLVRRDGPDAEVGDMLRALLVIADRVRRDPFTVSGEDVARARAAGADDQAIHDTVLVAATFSMFNRYVDGLATWQPSDPALYEQIGRVLTEDDYQPAAEL